MTASQRTAIRAAQDRLASLLGCEPDERESLVAGMVQRNPTETTSYWLQLVVSIGIGTLGLVLGSTAAVIGAMLVAPLMGPIVGLAMGLATGSPFLVLRSAGRVFFSVGLVVAGAAGITLLLPFHELNAEIAARTTPNALDLLTAAFCALAGVYATLRPGSNTTTTAAGTSISISLVPPLCASGFGVGTALWSVAGGAALLFLTNLVAIVVVGTVSFLTVGFNQVSVQSIEAGEIGRAGGAPVSRAVARRLESLLGSRSRPWLRLLMPFLLLAVVYLPLRRALNEVVWEARVRSTTQQSISTLGLPLVQSRVRVERHRIDIAIAIVGKSADADATRAHLERDIGPVAGIKPHIEVLAIPDAASFAGLESTLRAPVAASAPTQSPSEKLEDGRQFVDATVRKYWPQEAAGPVLAVNVSSTGSPLVIRVVHQGPDLAKSTREVLQRSLGAELDRPVVVVASALPSSPIVRHDDLQFLTQLSSAMQVSKSVAGISVCAYHPPDPPAWRIVSAHERAFSKAVQAMLADNELTATVGSEWMIAFHHGACPHHGAQSPDAGTGAESGTDAGAIHD